MNDISFEVYIILIYNNISYYDNNMFKENFKKEFTESTKKDAYKYLVTDMLINPKRGDDKFVTMGAMNMEDTFNKDMIPSMIYTFVYASNSIDDILGHKFIDKIPIIMCTKVDADYVYGFNFNLLPNSARSEFLEMIYKAYKDFYDKKLDDAVKTNKAIINQELADFLMSEKSCDAFIKLVSSRLNYDISKIFRKYQKSKIKFARLIEFDLWKYIPYLTYNDAIRGCDLVKMQTDIIKNK